MEPRPSKEDIESMIEDGSVFEKYEKMVFRIAHQMKNTHPQEDLQELISEGFYGMIVYLPKYDPTKSAFNTWCYKCIWGQMKTFCLDPKRHRNVATDITNPMFEIPVEPTTWLQAFKQHLSEDAIDIISIILSAPEDIINMRAPVASKNRLVQFLKSLQWDKKKIENGMKDIRKCLQNSSTL